MKRRVASWQDLMEFTYRHRAEGHGYRYERKLKARYYKYLQERGLVVPMRFVSQSEIDAIVADRVAHNNDPGAWWLRVVNVIDRNSTTFRAVYQISRPGYYRVDGESVYGFTTRFARGYPDYRCWRACEPELFKEHERQRRAAWDEHFQVTELLRCRAAAKDARRRFRSYLASRRRRISVGRKFWGTMAAAGAVA